ncbi:hypothetical protein Neosp_009054 [[Neocosmospora] mangrovei]
MEWTDCVVQLLGDNEELHLLVSQMRVARIFLSTLQTELQSCRTLLLAKYGNPNWKPCIAATAIFLAFGVSIFFPPFAISGFYFAGGAALSGGCAGIQGVLNHQQQKKGDDVVAREMAPLENMVNGLDKAFGNAHLAAALMFCNQVFEVPLDTMNLNEQKSVLKDLGIDMSQMRDVTYTEELVADRLKVLSLRLEEYKVKRTEVGKQAGLKDLRLAVGS